jgi:hypothetical protein
MRLHLIIVLTVLATVWAGSLNAEDLTGNWQGTLKAGIDLRLIIRISKQAGGWQAFLSSIDQSPDWDSGAAANSVTLEGSDFKLKIDAVRGSYEGKPQRRWKLHQRDMVAGHPIAS